MVATHDKTPVRGSPLPEVPDLELERPTARGEPKERRRESQSGHPERGIGGATASRLVVDGGDGLGFGDEDSDVGNQGFAIGDRALDAPTATRQSSHSEPLEEVDFDNPPTAEGSVGRVEVGSADGFDAFGFGGLDELEEPSTDLELDETHVDQRAGSMPRPHQPAYEPPMSIAPEIPREEIDALSGYGAAPSSILLAPAYAIRVTLRRRQLAVELARSKRELADTELERDRLLASAVRRLRPGIEADEHFARALHEADALEKRMGALGAEVLRLESEHTKVSTELGARVAEANQSLGQAKQAEEAAARDLETAQRNVARGEAKRKRLEIEMRNAEGQGADGAARSTEQSLSAIVARIDALDTELVALRDAANAAKSRVDAARSATRHCGSEREQREADVRRSGERFARERSTRMAAVHDEEVAWVAALANVMRKVLAAPGCAELPQHELTAIRDADALVAERARAAERYSLAYDSHDSAAVKKGLTLLVVAAVLVVALLVGLAVS